MFDILFLEKNNEPSSKFKYGNCRPEVKLALSFPTKKIQILCFEISETTWNKNFSFSLKTFPDFQFSVSEVLLCMFKLEQENCACIS